MARPGRLELPATVMRIPFPFQCICGMGMRDGLVLLLSMKRETWPLGIPLALVCVTSVVPAHAVARSSSAYCKDLERESVNVGHWAIILQDSVT